MASPQQRPVRAASIVIPAYNEGRVLRRCLDALREVAGLDLEIVVAANGCTDDTVAVARSVPGVTVLEVPVASKAAALNAGDAAAARFPRVFLDADIVFGPGALSALVAALDVPEARVAAPHVRFVTEGCTRSVRLFYDAYRETPYIRAGLVGLGVYGLSRAARERFDRFPDLQADDLFVQRLFAPHERLTTDGHFEVRAPRDLANLVKVRTRIATGNAALARSADAASTDSANGVGAPRRVEAGAPAVGTATTAAARPAAGEDGADPDFSATTGSTIRSLLATVRRRPTLAPAAATYVGVITAARLRARRAASATTWHRDESTR